MNVHLHPVIFAHERRASGSSRVISRSAHGKKTHDPPPTRPLLALNRMV
jgi:hypothetical protein